MHGEAQLPFFHKGLPFLLEEAQKGPLSIHQTGNLLLHLLANAGKSSKLLCYFNTRGKKLRAKNKCRWMGTSTLCLQQPMLCLVTLPFRVGYRIFKESA